MKRNIILILIILITFSSYLIIINKKKDYTIEYNINTYTVKENFNKKKNVYLINIFNSDTNYSFFLKKKYSNARKIVSNIQVEEHDGYTCVKPIISKEQIEYQCSKNGEYFVDKYQEINNTKIKTIDNTDIYSEQYIYYTWDGYGIKNVLTNKSYDFLKKEHFENVLSFQTEDKLVFANYDEERYFKKFYVFDIAKEEFEIIESEFEISYDTYYLGLIKNKLYFFDRKNMTEYYIDFKKKNVIKANKEEVGVYYDNGIQDINISKFKYNDLIFKYNAMKTYSIDDNKLYVKYPNSENEILITNSKVKDIVAANDSIIYYLSDSTLYSYDDENKNQALLQNFEWKFSYKSRIFIFNNKNN